MSQNGRFDKILNIYGNLKNPGLLQEKGPHQNSHCFAVYVYPNRFLQPE